ncbi:MAG: hypothetical protein ACOYL3_27145 [Desulfuromonadaceae bacterium]
MSEQLSYIVKTCDIAVSGTYSAGNKLSVAGDGGASYYIHRHATLDAEELFVHVVDHLKEDSYRRIREFQGRSSITTYITAIIGRLVVDLVRQRTGRNRAKERSESQGELGRHVYDLMVKRGHSADEAADILLTNFSIQASAGELMELHRSMMGRDVRHQSCAETETAWGADGEFVVVQRQNPEMELVGHTQNVRRRNLLASLIEDLKGEDRLLVRLRFPLDDETPPLDMEQIAVMTGQTSQQADRKLRRILMSCREELLKKGHRLDDLL